MAKQNIYDNETFFEDFREKRSREVNFNDCLETPILTAMLPDLTGKTVLDVGCGMGQHAKQYADLGASSVTGIDISEKMLEHARTHFSAPNITYRKLAMEDLGTLHEPFDVITSSLAFDYAEDFTALMADLYGLLKPGGTLVYSMSHPMATAWDGAYDRYTRTETGERLYANVRNYAKEGLRKVRWVVEDYEVYHRTFATIVNAMTSAGFLIEECRESCAPEELLAAHPGVFGGSVHRPDFVFFRCRRM